MANDIYNSTPAYYGDYSASPFTYTGGLYAGQTVAQAGGDLVHSVAAPVVGFGQGLLHGRLILAVAAVAALVLISRNAQ